MKVGGGFLCGECRKKTKGHFLQFSPLFGPTPLLSSFNIFAPQFYLCGFLPFFLLNSVFYYSLYDYRDDRVI